MCLCALHLDEVLRILWRTIDLLDGNTARTLVLCIRAKLVQVNLPELQTGDAGDFLVHYLLRKDVDRRHRAIRQLLRLLDKLSAVDQLDQVAWHKLRIKAFEQEVLLDDVLNLCVGSGEFDDVRVQFDVSFFDLATLELVLNKIALDDVLTNVLNRVIRSFVRLFESSVHRREVFT